MSDSKSKEEAIKKSVDSMFKIGALWANYGLNAGKSALEASARTLQTTAETLETLAERFKSESAK